MSEPIDIPCQTASQLDTHHLPFRANPQGPPSAGEGYLFGPASSDSEQRSDLSSALCSISSAAAHPSLASEIATSTQASELSTPTTEVIDLTTESKSIDILGEHGQAMSDVCAPTEAIAGYENAVITAARTAPPLAQASTPAAGSPLPCTPPRPVWPGSSRWVDGKGRPSSPRGSPDRAARTSSPQKLHDRYESLSDSPRPPSTPKRQYALRDDLFNQVWDTSPHGHAASRKLPGLTRSQRASDARQRWQANERDRLARNIAQHERRKRAVARALVLSVLLIGASLVILSRIDTSSIDTVLLPHFHARRSQSRAENASVGYEWLNPEVIDSSTYQEAITQSEREIALAYQLVKDDLGITQANLSSDTFGILPLAAIDNYAQRMYGLPYGVRSGIMVQGPHSSVAGIDDATTKPTASSDQSTSSARQAHRTHAHVHSHKHHHHHQHGHPKDAGEEILWTLRWDKDDRSSALRKRDLATSTTVVTCTVPFPSTQVIVESVPAATVTTIKTRNIFHTSTVTETDQDTTTVYKTRLTTDSVTETAVRTTKQTIHAIIVHTKTVTIQQAEATAAASMTSSIEEQNEQTTSSSFDAEEEPETVYETATAVVTDLSYATVTMEADSTHRIHKEARERARQARHAQHQNKHHHDHSPSGGGVKRRALPSGTTDTSTQIWRIQNASGGRDLAYIFGYSDGWPWGNTKVEFVESVDPAIPLHFEHLTSSSLSQAAFASGYAPSSVDAIHSTRVIIMTVETILRARSLGPGQHRDYSAEVITSSSTAHGSIATSHLEEQAATSKEPARQHDVILEARPDSSPARSLSVGLEQAVGLPVAPRSVSTMRLTYDVLFPETFNFRSQGKLPGLHGRLGTANYTISPTWEKNGTGLLLIDAENVRQSGQACKAPPQTDCRWKGKIYAGIGAWSFPAGSWSKLDICIAQTSPASMKVSIFVNDTLATQATDVTFTSSQATVKRETDECFECQGPRALENDLHDTLLSTQGSSEVAQSTLNPTRCYFQGISLMLFGSGFFTGLSVQKARETLYLANFALELSND
ncbi:uncharacterized protein L969DRAFT_26393 [Mixia osmundae IAM 14324]|uniref:Polysaccharide lyase 14 domain-containing protein n=1 Tax=Mixia osmundae (strain CBS 9802 / IAM 14324 / JCM 22182 / KY 12970) TaxID=764103 RepID=G7E1J1_MIXOS|nr:uncharacterized protein L969DRAFT_26393 [Mixia osmundae IAM 14324]KEI36654.1 hypothetical protein L969DRAFT_26393 [Mixia osmundae IAM 14324]GAA96701.1 hypothetical protein E5Q_03372 [Mixia osmundae IAM 14324]